jgi:hypothetical protein
LKVYETETEVLQHMIVPLCHWGSAGHEICAVNIVELAADYSTLETGMFREVWANLSFFPSLFLFYAGGLAAVSAENYGMFAALVNRPKYRDHQGEKPLCLTLPLRKVFGEALGEARTEYKTFQGSSVYLSKVLRPLFQDTIHQDYRFDTIFDRFEYLFALARADNYERATSGSSWDGRGSISCSTCTS